MRMWSRRNQSSGRRHEMVLWCRPHEIDKLDRTKTRFSLCGQSKGEDPAGSDAIQRAINDSLPWRASKGHLRNERYPQPALHHSEHRTNLRAPTADLGMESLSFAKLLGLRAEAMPILHEDEFFLLQIGGDHFFFSN